MRLLTPECNFQQSLLFLSLHDFCLTPGEDLMISWYEGAIIHVKLHSVLLCRPYLLGIIFPSYNCLVLALVMRERNRLQGGNMFWSTICCHAFLLLFVLLYKGYFSIHNKIESYLFFLNLWQRQRGYNKFPHNRHPCDISHLLWH